MKSIEVIAQTESLEDLKRAYPNPAPRAIGVLRGALANNSIGDRLSMSMWLLDCGVDPSPTSADGSTGAHVLVDRVRHDFLREAPLLHRLLEAGVDVNAVAGRWGTALQTLLRQFNVTDTEMSPFCDVFFSRSDLDLLKPGWRGISTLQLARNGMESRVELTERMEKYLTDCGIVLPEREV